MLDQVERARSAISDLVGACRALPDFDTLQIALFPIIRPPSRTYNLCRRCPDCDCDQEWRTEIPGKHPKGLEEWAMDCLKSKTGCREGEGRGRTTFRVIKFGDETPCQSTVEVEEYES